MKLSHALPSALFVIALTPALAFAGDDPRYDYTVYASDEAGKMFSVREHGSDRLCVIDQTVENAAPVCGEDAFAQIRAAGMDRLADTMTLSADDADEDINFGTRNWGMRVLASEQGETDKANVEIRRGKTRMNIRALDGADGDYALIETTNASAKEVRKMIADLEDVDQSAKDALMREMNLAD